MTADELRQAHARAAGCANRLRLPLRRKVWRGGTGEFAGSGTGSSLDFQDHRHYAPGDDPRHINWQAYARTGQYTMKLYREEVRPLVDLLVDVSPSMFLDGPKSARTAELVAFFTESCQRAGAELTIHFLSGAAHRLVPGEAVSQQKWFPLAQELQEKDPAGSLNLHAVPLRQTSFRVLISDLLFPGEPQRLLHPLAARQGSPLLFVPFLQSEAQPDWEGNYEFIDAERTTRHPHRIEPRVLQKYLSAYQRHFTLWKEASQRQQALLARVPADLDLEKALFHEAVPLQALELLNG
ncbi:DUF58 domain-containing protein [Roseibacillus ishigakijimensis]|uniref:DUF58 domain-containing protein n=1 Tax=Roseibacillus ishigakijimensis TaxID=454146 RepID=A0A934RSF9_9BACT|nr:DUF58 domain-containing protein [Roseibacillus ishigakijimensis]MBK1834204.1 DUF58 domain-containing protein [Roseibacillus ishigakijimensis]